MEFVFHFFLRKLPGGEYLTIIPRARMGYESIAMACEGMRNNCFSKIKLVRQK